MSRPKKRASIVLRPDILEDRRLLSGDMTGTLENLSAMMAFDVRGAADGAAEFDQTRIIVRYRDDVIASAAPHPNGLTPGRTLGENSNLRVVGVNPLVGVEQTLAAARQDPRVAYAEPDYVIQASTMPDDPRFGELWGLNNLSRPEADVDAPIAWQRETGNDSVIVAVLDSGVDYNHPDLAANIWTNPGEIPGNGIDDDGNGYTDDIRGWDFINRDNNPMDDNKHGTHVAGTIGAVGDNGIGVTGVAWNVSIMPLKVLDQSGNGTVSAAIDALSYAYKNGATISNASWGASQYSQALRDMIDRAGSQADHLIVAAAGNSGTVLDLAGSTPFYPASYDAPNIISVAASDQNDQVASFSNIGWASVDLAAPGVGILSTVPGQAYAKLSGTSMASPHVAGAAALLKSTRSSLSASEIKSALLDTVDQSDNFIGRTVSGGKLNLAKAHSECCSPGKPEEWFDHSPRSGSVDDRDSGPGVRLDGRRGHSSGVERWSLADHPSTERPGESV